LVPTIYIPYVDKHGSFLILRICYYWLIWD